MYSALCISSLQLVWIFCHYLPAFRSVIQQFSYTAVQCSEINERRTTLSKRHPLCFEIGKYCFCSVLSLLQLYKGWLSWPPKIKSNDISRYKSSMAIATSDLKTPFDHGVFFLHHSSFFSISNRNTKSIKPLVTAYFF